MRGKVFSTLRDVGQIKDQFQMPDIFKKKCFVKHLVTQFLVEGAAVSKY